MSDIAALVAGNLDIWTSATQRKSGAGRGGGKRISLYGIERLRALILDLAVQGKLVPQDAGDEPASRLLARITVERKALQQAGRISKPKNLPPIDVDELSVPHTWVATRFGAIFSLEYGDNLPEPKRTGSGEYNVFGSNGVVGTHDSFTVDKPCLVVGRKGSAGAVNKSQWPCWVTDVAYYCVPPTGIDLDFQYVLFRTLGLDELGKGIKPGLNRNEANVLAVLLPPLAEQRRIVAKVDELVALCDALERESAGAMAAHQALVEELLATLVNSADATDLAANWARLETHFDTLFTTDVSIEALKQTILDLAVRGRLVESSVAVKHGILGQAGDWIGGNGFPMQFQGKSEGEVPFLKVSDMNLPGNERHITTSNNYVSTDEMRAMRAKAHPAGTIIFPKIGGAIATNKRRILSVPSAIDNNCAGQVPRKGIDVEWLFMVLSSIDMAAYQAGTSVPALNMKRLAQHPVAIPTESEQRRIVAKVDELIALCDALKSRLADAAQTQRHLADAIVERAVA